MVRRRRRRGTRYPPPFPVVPPPTAPLLLPCGVPSPPASPLCLLPPPTRPAGWERSPQGTAPGMHSKSHFPLLLERGAREEIPRPRLPAPHSSPAPGLGFSSSLSSACVGLHLQEHDLRWAEQQLPDRDKLGGSLPSGRTALLDALSSNGGALAALLEAPNLEGADPWAGVNTVILPRSWQESVANRVPSSP